MGVLGASHLHGCVSDCGRCCSSRDLCVSSIWRFQCCAVLTSAISPIILVKRAQKLRKDTGDDRYWAPLEKNKVALVPHIKRVLSRPFIVLAREPMLVAITLYMSVSPFRSTLTI